MNHSSLVGASICTTCEAIIMARPVDKIIIQSTTKTTNLLEQQLTQAAGVVTINQWGGRHGFIALVLPEDENQVITGINTSTVNCQAKPALLHPGININTTHYEHQCEHYPLKIGS